MLPVEVNSHLIYCDGKPIAIQAIARELTVQRHAETMTFQQGERCLEMF